MFACTGAHEYRLQCRKHTGLGQGEQQDSLVAADASLFPGQFGSRYKRPSDASRRFIAAGKVQATAFGSTDSCKNITWQEGAVTRAEKESLLGQRGCVIWCVSASITHHDAHLVCQTCNIET